MNKMYKNSKGQWLLGNVPLRDVLSHVLEPVASGLRGVAAMRALDDIDRAIRACEPESDEDDDLSDPFPGCEGCGCHGYCQPGCPKA